MDRFRRIRSKGLFLGILVLLLCCSCVVSRKQAEESERQGEFARASSLYVQLYRRTRISAKVLKAYYAWHAAENYRRARIYTRALNFYRTAERYSYPDSVLYLRLGQMSHAVGDYHKAREYYLRYQAVDSSSYWARIGLLGCQMALNSKTRGKSNYRVEFAKEWSSSASDFAPLFSSDGHYLYISSSRGKAVQERSAITGERASDLWVVRRDQHLRWEHRLDTMVGGINTPAEEGVASISNDGNTLYYTYAERSNLYPRTAQIYRSARSRDKGWEAGSVVDVWRDSLTMAAHPTLTPSGSALFFVSDAFGGLGGKDIYRVSLSGNSIGTPVPLDSPVNTPGDELYPYAVSDSLLYFSSDGHPGLGGLDLYRAKLLPSGAWRVELLPSPLNSAADDYSIALDPKLPTAPGEEELAERGVIASTRGDTRGRPHLYRFELPKTTTHIAGYIMDRDEYAIPGATIRLVGSRGGGERLTHSREDGSYSLKAEGATSYVMLATAPGYLNQYIAFATEPADSSEIYQVDFRLASRGAIELLEHIYYAFDKAEIEPESESDLKDLLQILKDNPDVSIELSAHADRHGGAEYNERLSKRRAESVVNYLRKEGIAENRLVAIGYGQRRPAVVSKRQSERYPFLVEGKVLTPEYIATLSESEQSICDALCRRTEFVVLSTLIQEP